MEDTGSRLDGSPFAPPIAPTLAPPPGTPSTPPPLPTGAALVQAGAPTLPPVATASPLFEAAPQSPWAPSAVPEAPTVTTPVVAPAPAFLGSAPADPSPFAPPGQYPTVAPQPTPVSAIPTPFVAPAFNSPSPLQPHGSAHFGVTPTPETKKSRGPFIAVMALIAVVAVGIGAFMVMRGGGSSDDYSFAAAAARAQAAGSMTVDFNADSAEGPVDGVIEIDRASRRMSIELDLSQLEPADDGAVFEEAPDSYNLIVDEPTSTMYMNSDVLGFFDIDTAWVSVRTDEEDGFGQDLDQVFANPFDITDVLAGAEHVDLGMETIDGEELRHYRVTTNADSLSVEPGTDSSLDLNDTDYDVWVTQDNEIRRIEYEFDDDGDIVQFVMTVQASSESIDIQLPDPADVTDFDELFEMDFEAHFETDFESDFETEFEFDQDFETEFEFDVEDGTTIVEDGTITAEN